MGLSMPEYRSLIATDLKVTVATEMSIAELDRAVQRAVNDLSRYFPLELVHEETLDFTVTDETMTTPATADPDYIVDNVTLNGETAGATLSLSNYVPDVPRRLTVTLTDANHSVTTLTIIVKGYDQDGNYIEESWYLKDLVSGTALQGNLYFKRVNQVEVDSIAGSLSAADIIDVGTGNAYDSYVFLTHRPIRPESEEVTNAAGTTEYTRDTDYTMDYTNGAIKFINGGSMAANTAYLIDYTKSRLGINISDLLPVVTRISKVQYPASNIPQEFVSFNIVGDFMYVATKLAGQSQEELTDGKHLVIWYEKSHAPPGEGSPGSYPSVLDEVVVIGAAGYALLTEAQQYEQAAAAVLATSGTGTLGAALTNVVKYLNNNTNADMAGILQDITDNASELRTAIIDSLTNAHTYLNGVLTISLDKGTTGAEAYLDTGDGNIDAVNIGSRVAEIYADYARARVDMANARINGALGYIQEATTRLNNLATYIQQAGGYNQLAAGFLSEAGMRAESVNGNLVLADRFRLEGLARLNEFHSILRNKAEARRRTSSIPTKQPA